MSKENIRIHITGIVQGVGFRPYVFNLAEQYALTGWVQNTSHGVEIEIRGDADAVRQFIATLRDFPPPLAEIDSFQEEPAPDCHFSNFEILFSQDEESDFLPVSPDIAICEDCKKELFDPNDRRYRYPFINCTNCGPRFTITARIPYDRPNTSMGSFILCPQCQTEYEDPRDRRFHAQPIACPVCGPKVWLDVNQEKNAESEEAIQLTRKLIRDGKIVAIKGLGGFHLACDAFNAEAIQKLRERKKRSDKPFALMANDLKTIQQYAIVNQNAEALMSSPQAPIVLIKPTQLGKELLRLCAPGQNKLGFFLPYTPLHLLMLEPESDFPQVLVMTSANLSEEPIAYQNEQAISQLGNLADAFLMHDRPIVMRIDDSVFAQVDEQPYPVRRARGFAPNPIRLPMSLPSILGTGPLLKNTFCLSRDKYAFSSHYIGDLENFETLQSYEEAIQHYESLFRIHPQLIACDLHPDYLATRYALERQNKEKLPLIQIQHHHAHIAACLADNHWASNEPVIGLAYDGTGYGSDGHIWGGEILIASYKNFKRRFHLDYVPMPGGDLAVRKPSRMAVSYLITSGIALDETLPPINALAGQEVMVIRQQIENKINAPLTSSMGRLFDAVSALIGLREEINYEGQAAIELEAIVDPYIIDHYMMEAIGHQIKTQTLIRGIVDDTHAGQSISVISAKFHNSIVKMSLEACQTIRDESGINTVALSGGVWQNLFLIERTLKELKDAGFRVLIHHQVPTNDACISLGQVLVAAHQDQKI